MSRLGARYSRYDPVAPADSHFLLAMYGRGQLRTALERYSTPRLSNAVRQVKAERPGTKPAGRGKQAILDYLLQYTPEP